jgi:hypothetical protein
VLMIPFTAAELEALAAAFIRSFVAETLFM